MRLPRSTGAISGSLVVLLGLWGALIPFVGPHFDYSFGSNVTWHYTTNRLALDILPGALAVVAGGLLLAARTRRGHSGRVAWLACGSVVCDRSGHELLSGAIHPERCARTARNG